MGVFDSLVTAANPKHHRRYPSSHDIRRHEGSAAARNPWNPPQHRAKHEHAAAIVHLAEHVPDKTLAAHLLHYAFPTTVPKPSAPLTDQLLVSLADHLDQAIHHVSHPTRPAIVSGAVRAAMADHPARPKTIIRENPRLAAAAKHSAKEVTSGFKPGTTATASVNGGGAGVARTNAGRAARGKGPDLGHSPGPKLAAKLGPELRKGLGENPWIAGLEGASLALPIGEGATALKEALGAGGAALAEKIGLIGRAAEGTRAGKAVGGAVRAATAKAGESGVGRAATAAAERAAPLTRPVGTGLKYGAKHPIQGSTIGVTAAQVPAFATTGDPSQLLKGLEGTGALATILGGAGNTARNSIGGPVGNALADLISLPAQVPPSIYLTGRAGVKAATGDTTEAKQLLSQFEQQDPLGALISGNPSQALHNLGEHPVYGALEALGIKSAVGHGIGRVQRAGEAGFSRESRMANPPEQRPPINIQPGMSFRRGPYSRDAIQAAIQRRLDQRRMGKQGPGPIERDIHGRPIRTIAATEKQAGRYRLGSTDRGVYGSEAVRKGEMSKLQHELDQGKLRTSQADVVSLMAQRIARNPEQAVGDLAGYQAHLAKAAESLQTVAKTADTVQERGWAKVELQANERLRATIAKALKNPNPEAVAAAADNYVRLMAPLQRELIDRGLINPDQAAKAAVIPYARFHMGAEHGLSVRDQQLYDHVYGQWRAAKPGSAEKARLWGQMSKIRARKQLLTHNGEPLPTEAIHAHMERAGVPMEGDTPSVGFQTQRMGSKGRAAFFRPATERPRLASGRRTGEATAKGTFDPSYEALKESAISAQSTVSQARAWDRFVGRNALTKPDGTDFQSVHEARIFAEEPQHFDAKMPPGEYIPVRRTPWLDKKAALEAQIKHGPGHAVESAKAELAQMDSLAHADSPEAERGIMESFLNAATDQTIGGGKGDFVLMPKNVVDRLRQHYESMLPIEKTAQALTGGFKGAILPTSPGWATGNIVDNYLVRMFGTGLTPAMARAGKGFGGPSGILEQELGPEAAHAMESITPGGLYGSYKRIQPYRDLSQFAGSAAEPFWRAAHAVRQAPFAGRVGDLYGKYRDWIFHIDGKYVEQTPQYAELSRTAQHDLGITRRQWRAAVKAGDPAVRQLARGLRNTDEQIRYAKRVEATFGNWGKSSPAARRFLTTWAPFWMWSRAALKFVYVTLPKDHPILTGILAATENATRKERQQLGLDFAGDKPLPDYMQGSVPNPLGPGLLKVSNLSSFGYAADIPGNLARVPAPQFSSGIMALAGLDWKGDKLVDSQGRPASQLDRGKVAATTIGESFLPFMNVGNAMATKGALEGLNPAKAYDPSTLKFLRSLHNMQQISVPVSKGGSSSSSAPSNPWSSSGSAPSSNPWSTSSSSSSANPWKP